MSHHNRAFFGGMISGMLIAASLMLIYEGSIIFYLPEFMTVQLGADSSTVVEYNVVDGAAVQRAPDAFAKEL